MKLCCINLLWSPWILYFHRWAGQLAYHQTQKRSSRDPQDRAAMWGEGLRGSSYLRRWLSNTQGAPKLKTMGPCVQETLTQPVPFPSLPAHSETLPAFLLLGGFVLSPTSWQRGMLIKGHENQKHKSLQGHDNKQTMMCVTLKWRCWNEICDQVTRDWFMKQN